MEKEKAYRDAEEAKRKTGFVGKMSKMKEGLLGRFK
jgi:hypothetical protein